MESKNCPCCYKTYPLSFFVPDTGNNNKVFSTCINCRTRSRQYRNESRTETPNSETCASGIVRTMDLRNKRLAYNDRSSPRVWKKSSLGTPLLQRILKHRMLKRVLLGLLERWTSGTKGWHIHNRFP